MSLTRIRVGIFAKDHRPDEVKRSQVERPEDVGTKSRTDLVHATSSVDVIDSEV